MKGLLPQSLRVWMVCLGTWFSFSWCAAQASPQLSVQDDSQVFLTLGSVLPRETFFDAQVEAMMLPIQGRYLLWIADGDMALETRESVPAAELIPFAPEGASFFDLTAIVERFTIEPGYVVFYQEEPGVPSRRER
ncbi:MAG: hypothetical protein M3511_11995, partial [Deinococcota bacterium]|nr:hypothetical protein [Deinococcota bacterium]